MAYIKKTFRLDLDFSINSTLPSMNIHFRSVDDADESIQLPGLDSSRLRDENYDVTVPVEGGDEGEETTTTHNDYDETVFNFEGKTYTARQFAGMAAALANVVKP